MILGGLCDHWRMREPMKTNLIENVNPTLSSSVGDCGRLFLSVLRFKISAIVLQLAKFCIKNHSMVITEEFVCVIFEIVSLGIFLRRFTVSSYQRALYWQRINDGYFTMSDGMLNGIFLIVHRTFLLSCFRGCWLLDFFVCVLKVCGHVYNEAPVELAAAVFH